MAGCVGRKDKEKLKEAPVVTYAQHFGKKKQYARDTLLCSPSWLIARKNKSPFVRTDVYLFLLARWCKGEEEEVVSCPPSQPQVSLSLTYSPLLEKTHSP